MLMIHPHEWSRSLRAFRRGVLWREITREAGIPKNTGFQVDHMAVIMVAHGSVKGQLVFKGNVFKVRPRG